MDPVLVLILVAAAVVVALWFADEIRIFLYWLFDVVVDLVIGACVVVAAGVAIWFFLIR